MLSRTLPTLADRLAQVSLNAQGYLSRYVETSVGRVHAIDVRGNGPLPPLVLLHGFSASAVHYYGLFQRLRHQTRRLIAPDMPGHGFSDMPRGGLDTKTITTGLLEALDGLIGEPVVVFGNSMGGMAAARFATMRPEVVRGLVLVSPAGAPMTHEELDAFVGSFAMDHKADALDFVHRLYHVPPRRGKRFLAWGIRERFRRESMRQLMASITPDDLLSAGEVARLSCPTLLLWGQSERILPPSGLDFFREALPPHAWVEEPEGWGHGPFMEHPDQVAGWVLRFLETVDQIEERQAAERAG